MKRLKNVTYWIVAILTLTFLVACDQSTGSPSTNPVRGTQVAVVDNAFEPAALEVSPGADVTWTWEGSNPHDVKADGFASEVQRDGTFTQTFDTEGEYEYRCTVHPRMVGTIIVTSQ